MSSIHGAVGFRETVAGCSTGERGLQPDEGGHSGGAVHWILPPYCQQAARQCKGLSNPQDFQVDLVEISLVTQGANPQARLNNVKRRVFP